MEGIINLFISSPLVDYTWLYVYKMYMHKTTFILILKFKALLHMHAK